MSTARSFCLFGLTTATGTVAVVSEEKTVCELVTRPVRQALSQASRINALLIGKLARVRTWITGVAGYINASILETGLTETLFVLKTGRFVIFVLLAHSVKTSPPYWTVSL